jgi:hypothetical protein
MTVKSFKMPFQTAAFNKNQRVWIGLLSGDAAAKCVGRWRGSGRYVRAWVNWSGAAKTQPEIQTFEVDDDFANRHGLA